MAQTDNPSVLILDQIGKPLEVSAESPSIVPLVNFRDDLAGMSYARDLANFAGWKTECAKVDTRITFTTIRNQVDVATNLVGFMSSDDSIPFYFFCASVC